MLLQAPAASKAPKAAPKPPEVFCPKPGEADCIRIEEFGNGLVSCRCFSALEPGAQALLPQLRLLRLYQTELLLLLLCNQCVVLSLLLAAGLSIITQGCKWLLHFRWTKSANSHKVVDQSSRSSERRRSASSSSPRRCWITASAQRASIVRAHRQQSHAQTRTRRHVLESRKRICIDMRASAKLITSELMLHSYPIDYCSVLLGTPIIHSV